MLSFHRASSLCKDSSYPRVFLCFSQSIRAVPFIKAIIVLDYELMKRIPFNDLRETLYTILIREGFSEEKAAECARIFSENTLDGVASHGVNRFPRFVEQTREGIIQIDTEPEKTASFAAIEQWDGKHGIGPLNALFCTDRAMEIAREHGIGCVALKNTSHWMRAGTYGWRAAEQGFLFICWTNTTPNMPPWGAKKPAVGNDPLVLAVPREKGHLVLDMALSQFSYGKLGVYRSRSAQMPYNAGFDEQDKLTKDPAQVLKTGRVLPIGLWKGSGLSVMLDLFAGILSGGFLTHEIPPEERTLSQVFIALHVDAYGGRDYVNTYAEKLVQDLKSIPAEERSGRILYPGEGSLARREDNLKNGVPVDQKIWDKIKKLP